MQPVGQGRADMARTAVIRAAGVVLLREADGQREVLIVHRPGRADWSLPKGKLEQGERAKEAALREVLEETGVRCVLGTRLPNVTYQHEGAPKRVKWWAITVAEDHGHTPDDEVQEVRWVQVERAREVLSYADDVATLDAALGHR